MAPRLNPAERQAFNEQLVQQGWEFMDVGGDAPGTPDYGSDDDFVPPSPPGAPVKPRLTSAERQARRAASNTTPLRRQGALVGVNLHRAFGLCNKQLGTKGQRYGPKTPCHHPKHKYGMCQYHWRKWKKDHPWQTHP